MGFVSGTGRGALLECSKNVISAWEIAFSHFVHSFLTLVSFSQMNILKNLQR